MTKKVAFAAMEHGSGDDYAFLKQYADVERASLADRILSLLQSLDGESPYRISRLQHSLQTATRAERDGADDETVVCALLHDIGDTLAPDNHSEFAASILAPFISEKNHWIVKHHGLFQGYYYFHFYDADRNARDVHRDHEYYAACEAFCARWDQASFDPEYETMPLEHFEARVRALFMKKPVPYY